MRTKQGIGAEMKDLKKFIALEEMNLKTGNRLGTFHNPQKRIKSYKLRLVELNELIIYEG